MEKINRHNMRITIVRGLVSIDLQKLSDLEDSELKDILLYAFDPENADEELYLNYKDSFDEMIVVLKDLLKNLPSIDEVIIAKLEGYRLERLNYTDRAIIRLATYEYLYKDTPKNIIIDEAILITKEYSNLDDGLQSKFNNRLLDNICKGKEQ